MKSVLLKNSRLAGKLDFEKIAASKSIMHREIICCALAGEAAPFFNSEDIKATYESVFGILNGDKEVNTRESASTLRFLIPLSLLFGGVRFKTEGSLKTRTLSQYACLCDAHIERDGDAVITSGKLLPGIFSLRGDVSSQFISGLLFALPLLDGKSEIRLTTPLESESYVSLTADALKRHKIQVQKTATGFIVEGNQSYKPAGSFNIEGDWSYAAFFVVANALGSNIILSGLNENSLSGDKMIASLLNESRIDISRTPDLFPALCVNACAKSEITLIEGAKRLRLKESDRLHAMAVELKKLGAELYEGEDYMEIHGKKTLTGGEVFSHNDHRILMALAIAALCICKGTVKISDIDCVKKSAPDFFKHIEALGARLTYISE